MRVCLSLCKSVQVCANLRDFRPLLSNLKFTVLKYLSAAGKEGGKSKFNRF